jgi:hypothetical protein
MYENLVYRIISASIRDGATKKQDVKMQEPCDFYRSCIIVRLVKGKKLRKGLRCTLNEREVKFMQYSHAKSFLKANTCRVKLGEID